MNRATWLGIPSIATFFLADLLQSPIRRNGVDFGTLTLTAEWDDASARLLFLSAALAVFAAFYLTLLCFVSDTTREFDLADRRMLWRRYGGGLAVGVAWVAGTWWLVGPPVDVAFAQAAIGVFQPPAQGANALALSRNFMFLMGAVRLALTFATGFVVLGGVSCMVEPATGVQTRSDLHRQRRRLRNYANLASVALVAGIAFQIAWMRWPALLLGKQAGPYLTYVNVAAIQLGVTGSAVIALFTVPAASVLASRALALPPPKDGEPAGDDGLFDKGLLDTLGKILVVMAPVLAGILPSLTEGLSKVH